MFAVGSILPSWRHDGDEDTSGFEQVMHVAHVINVLTVAKGRVGYHPVEHAKLAIASEEVAKVGVRVKVKLRHRGVQLDSRAINRRWKCFQDCSPACTGF